MTDRPDVNEINESSDLTAAIEALRVVPDASPGWRDRVLAEIEDTSPIYLSNAVKLGAPRFWSVRPPYAVAAALTCVVIGGAVGAVAMFGARRGEIADAPQASSVSRTDERIHFRFSAPSAANVSLAGDFNSWDPRAHPLRRSADASTWELDVRLPPGRYAYAFVVDGKLARDPSAPTAADDDFGTPHSILLVTGS